MALSDESSEDVVERWVSERDCPNAGGFDHAPHDDLFIDAFVDVQLQAIVGHITLDVGPGDSWQARSICEFDVDDALAKLLAYVLDAIIKKLDTAINEEDPIAKLLCLVKHVGREHDGLARLVHFADDAREQCCIDGIEPREWFVEHDQIGVVQDGGDELHLLLLSFGEFFASPRERFGKLQPFEPANSGFVGRSGRQTLEPPNVAKKSVNTHSAVEATLFREIADAVFGIERRTTEDLDRTCVRIDDRHDHPDRRALAGPVWAKESDEASRRNNQIQVIYCGDVPELLRHASNRDGGNDGTHSVSTFGRVEGSGGVNAVAGTGSSETLSNMSFNWMSAWSIVTL